MDFIYMWCERNIIIFRFYVIFIRCLLKYFRSSNLLIMQVVNILGDKHSLNFLSFFGLGKSNIFLEFSDSLMSLICCFTNQNFEEIVVPLPDSIWMNCKKFVCANFHWILFTCIISTFFPKSFLTSKCRNPTCSTDTCTSQDCNLFLSYQMLSTIFWLYFDWIMLEFFWFCYSSTHHTSNQVFHNSIKFNLEFFPFAKDIF